MTINSLVLNDDKFEIAITKRIQNLHSNFMYINKENKESVYKWFFHNPLSKIWDLRINLKYEYLDKKVDEKLNEITEDNVMTRIIYVYRGSRKEKLCIDSLRQGDTIRIYHSNSYDYREYYIACDSWDVKYIVSDKFDIYNFDSFIKTLPYFNNRLIEIL